MNAFSKVTLVALALTLTPCVFAQEESNIEADTREERAAARLEEISKVPGTLFGIRGGADLMYAELRKTKKPNLYWGWHVGAVSDVLQVADLGRSGKLWLQPGAYFISKNHLYKTIIDTKWLEIPVMLSYKRPVRSAGKRSIHYDREAFRAYVGPYVSFGLLGEFDKYDIGMSRIDTGFSGGLSYEWGFFWLGATYNYGFIDVNDVSGSISELKLSLGFNML